MVVVVTIREVQAKKNGGTSGTNLEAPAMRRPNDGRMFDNPHSMQWTYPEDIACNSESEADWSLAHQNASATPFVAEPCFGGIVFDKLSCSGSSGVSPRRFYWRIFPRTFQSSEPFFGPQFVFFSTQPVHCWYPGFASQGSDWFSRSFCWL